MYFAKITRYRSGQKARTFTLAAKRADYARLVSRSLAAARRGVVLNGGTATVATFRTYADGSTSQVEVFAISRYSGSPAAPKGDERRYLAGIAAKSGHYAR